jgi:hypothetical protein
MFCSLLVASYSAILWFCSGDSAGAGAGLELKLGLEMELAMSGRY